MLARETCATSGKGATGVTREMGKTRGESNLSASRLSRMSRASRFDRLTVLSHVEGRATSVALADHFRILLESSRHADRNVYCTSRVDQGSYP
jgi:hypothetical protein